MTPLSPPLLIAAAEAFIGMGVESETSRGRFLDLILAGVGQPIQGPWSAAFIHHVGYWSHYSVRGHFSSWPLPATSDPQDLAAFADERCISADVPERGDVFLYWSPAKRRFARAGIVVEVDGRLSQTLTGRTSWVCTTIEGDTTEFGAQTGAGIHLLRRNLSVLTGDCFVRWPALDARGAAADPAASTMMAAGRLLLRQAS